MDNLQAERGVTPSDIAGFVLALKEKERSAATVGKYVHDVSVFAEWLGDGVLQRTSVLEYKQKLTESYGKDGACTVCGYKKTETPATPIRGDFNGDGKVDSDDAIYLLKNIFFGKDYPLNQGGDLDGDGKVDSDDAIYLLKYVFFGNDYPLSKN